MNITQKIIEQLRELRDKIRYYGLVMGGILIFIDVLQYWQHNNITIATTSFLFFFKIAILFIATYQITKRIKASFFSAGMSYAQSFSLIMRLFLYASLLTGIFNFVLNRWIAPDYMSEVLHNSISMLKGYIDQANLPSMQEEYIDEFIDKIEDSPVPTPLSAMWSQMWSYIIWGVFVGFILSFFLRDKNINPLMQQEEIDNSNS